MTPNVCWKYLTGAGNFCGRGMITMFRRYSLIGATGLALAGLFLLVADLAETLSDRRLALELILIAPLILYFAVGRLTGRSDLRPS